MNILQRAVTCLVMLLSLTAYAQEKPAIIPLPNVVENVAGNFILNDNTPILVKDDTFLASANYLQQQILQRTGICLARQPRMNRPGITLQRLAKGTNSAEAYQLTMTDKSILLEAADSDGMFYGVISLLQLFIQAPQQGENRTVKCWNLQDVPQYTWRGFMLDESRHFFGKEVVKKLLDQMAFYKLNRFHWHLTDEPSWRLEIKQYPRLGLIGGIGSTSDSLAPAQFYRQTDVAEIIAYAAERHITVIPEIDMPGHATAANKAYPAYSGGGSAKHPEFTFNPGREETYQYLTNILKEVDALFPAKMIHLGGDEVSFGNDKWLKNPDIQKLMKTQALTNALQVEHYFLKRMADSVVSRNSRILAWDEVVEAGLSPENTLVFWWRHDKPEQLKVALDKKFPVVLCPRLPFYFDFVQDSLHRVGRKWDGKFNPLEQVYNFSHTLFPSAVANRNLIQGIQANVWTETIASKARLDYMLFPRLLALAEAAWTQPDKKNFDQFNRRLKTHIPMLQADGVCVYNPQVPTLTPEPAN